MNEMESVLESKVSSVQLAAKTAEVVDSYTDKFLTSKEFEKQLKISTQAIEEKIAEKARSVPSLRWVYFCGIIALHELDIFAKRVDTTWIPHLLR